jgi:hypothetical protein
MSTEYVERSSEAIGRSAGARRAGPRGTVARVIVGMSLIVLAVAFWRVTWLELLIGLVALPAVATLVMSLRRRSSRPLRLGAAGHLVTLAHAAVTVSIVPEAAALFYGSMMLVAGLQGNGGCEVTALANWLRGRDDQVGCPLFAPFDALDRTRSGSTRRLRRAAF